MERHLSKTQPLGMEWHHDEKSVLMPLVNGRLPMSTFLNIQYRKSPFLMHKLYSTYLSVVWQRAKGLSGKLASARERPLFTCVDLAGLLARALAVADTSVSEDLQWNCSNPNVFLIWHMEPFWFLFIRTV